MRVEAAAIQIEDKVYTLPRPARHNDVMRLIAEETGAKRQPPGMVQGFVADTGRFLTRKQAAGVALKAGQTPELKWPAHGLFSEDLW